MSDSKKDCPTDLASNQRWVKCRKCNRGVVIIGGEETNTSATPTDAEGKAEVVKEMQFEETIKTYVTIKKSSKGIVKRIYSDPERKVLVSEEKLG